MGQILNFKDAKIGICMGNHATTPNFQASTWTSLATTQLPTDYALLDIDPMERKPKRATGARHTLAPDRWNDAYGSVAKLSLAMPATLTTLDLFLAMATQRKVTEGASTPFVKDFALPFVDTTSWTAAGATYPDFFNDEGYYCTIVIDEYILSAVHAHAVMSAVPTRVRLSCYPDQNDSLLWIEADMIARYYQLGQDYSGTMTAYANANASMFPFDTMGVITLNAADFLTSGEFYGFEMVFDTGLTPVPKGGWATNGCQNYSMRGPTITGSVDVHHGYASSQTIWSLAASGQSTNACKIAWGDGTASTTGELDLNWLSQWGKPSLVGNEESIFRHPFECVGTTLALNNGFSAKFANAVDRAW